MRTVIWLMAALGVAGVVAFQQRELRAARLRGDMYRDIAARLDQRVVELGDGAHEHG
ncbi:MAG: hypothetical protein H7Z42_21225 [Roseiflexaceae bacterium]|nr:hypothetical protein [Roseiflexaceae bacterium]